jgi:DNA-binding CsgD family transcriptional regulator
MIRSAARDITDFAVSVLDELDAPAFPAEAVLALLCRDLDAAAGVFQCTRWDTGDTTLTPHGFGPRQATVLAELGRTRRFEHPLMVATARGDLAPSTAERAVGGRLNWRRSAVRNAIQDLQGWDQMTAVGLRGGPVEICGLAFARSGADFSTVDLALLAAVQPLLQAVERHTRRMAAWRERAAGPGTVAAARDAGLTAREVSVLVLLAEGLTATAVGRRLGCSPRTIEKHACNVYRKLGVGDRISAVLEAQRRGLLPVPRSAGTDPT